ncbi:hypothetical protein F4779DRAFT_612068, partial [Xylariaceae sp. FL0662B]
FFPSLPDGYFLEHYDRRWPAWKFGMRQDELFTTVAKQFNSITIPMLDLDSFNRDVCELSAIAQDKDAFFKLLDERRDMRQKELLDLWQFTFSHLATYPFLLPRPDGSKAPWKHAMQISYSQSFDSYVRYFAGFLQTKSPQPTLREPSDDATFPTPVPTDDSSRASASSEPIEPKPSDHEDEDTSGEVKPSRTVSNRRQNPTPLRSRDNRVQKRTSQEGKARRSLRIQERCSKSDAATQQTRRTISSKTGSQSNPARRERRTRPR